MNKTTTAKTLKLAREGGAQPIITKHALILNLLAQPEGASLAEMATATAWLPRTTRAMLTGLKKKGYVIESEKSTGERRYRVMTKQDAAA